MSFLMKDPDAALDYAVDWGADYLAGDVLVESNWTVDPAEDSGVRIIASSFDSDTASVTAEGGIAGHIYRLTNHVALSSGLADSRSILLRVEKR